MIKLMCSPEHMLNILYTNRVGYGSISWKLKCKIHTGVPKLFGTAKQTHIKKKKTRELTMIKCSNIIESTVSFVSNKRSRSSGNQEPTINSSHSKGRAVVLLENEACWAYLG